MPFVRSRAVRALLLPVLFTVGIVLAPAVGAGAAAGGELVGTFAVRAGTCAPTPAGSYFRMILPTGTVDGPFLDNSDSTCGDKSFTPLTGGSDGGLVTGGYQPAPDPGFDGSGNSLAGRIIRPVRFFGVDFGASTDPTDLQTATPVPVPVLRAVGGALSGELSAVDATWNRQVFNQGGPKPDGSHPGNTTDPTGTFDAATGAFTLTWASTIVGGPFNNFTGVWHLEGTFRPGAAAPAPAAGSPTAGVAPAAPAAVGSPAGGAAPVAGEVGAVAPTTLAPTDSPVAGEQVAAPDDAAQPSSDRTAPGAIVEAGSGWQAPVWLIVVVALLGLAAAGVLIAVPRPVVEVAD
jgi:hypothetical protein